ncbi:DNA-binding protein [Modestobacter sp. VKM Ac-2676]|nr:DNA-binding protein [Modestobacter sp. VKM Ac-2676]
MTETRADSRGGAPAAQPGARGWLSRALQKLTADDQEVDARALQSDVASAGCAPLSDCRKGEVVTVTGRLKSVVYTPRETVPTLEAELFDGSGSVTLVWLGRRRIPGIEPGRRLTAHGRFGAFDGRRVIYNPRYELSAG